MDQDYDRLIKAVVVGDSGVGKTCLVKQFADAHFPDGYVSTIGVDFAIRTVGMDGSIVKLQLWDTAGQERFRNITNAYYRGCHCVMIVYDITDMESFSNIERWLDEVRRYASDECRVMLVGNKSDLASKRAVSQEDAKALAEKLKLPLIETSARDSKAADATFLSMAKECIEARVYRDAAAAPQALPIDGQTESLTQRCCTIM